GAVVAVILRVSGIHADDVEGFLATIDAESCEDVVVLCCGGHSLCSFSMRIDHGYLWTARPIHATTDGVLSPTANRKPRRGAERSGGRSAPRCRPSLTRCR